jgi:hypothetical protein
MCVLLYRDASRLQYSKIQHLERRLTQADVSFDEGALPEIDSGPVQRPEFPAEMTAVIDDHFTEHGRAKSIYKCGENKALVNLVRGDVGGWHQKANEGMRYVSALGKLLVRTHDASGH